MKLKSLPGGHPQRPIGVAMGESVQVQPLFWRADACRHTHPNQKRIEGFQLLLQPLLTQITVILHVAAVKLDQLGITFGNVAGHRIVEALHQGAAQKITAGLERLVNRQGLFFTHQYTSL